MNLVLICPEIAGNTGNIARLCAATRTTLHLIEPFGFRLEDRELARAGMDYWSLVQWHRWSNWPAFCNHQPTTARFWFLEQGGERGYHQVAYRPDDYLVFGRETAGLPRLLLEQNPESWLHIPMANPAARSLNLANCAALVLFEALRQNDFPNGLSFPHPAQKKSAATTAAPKRSTI